MRYIFAPLLFIAGVLMMKYTVKLTQITGTVDFAEKYLKGGLLAGTFSWWRLIGLVFCILSVLWITGFLNFDFLGPILSGPGN